MMVVLRDYERISGQTVNKSKGSFYLHDKTPLIMAISMRRLTGIRQGNFPFKYLGCPIYYGRKLKKREMKTMQHLLLIAPIAQRLWKLFATCTCINIEGQHFHQLILQWWEFDANPKYLRKNGLNVTRIGQEEVIQGKAPMASVLEITMEIWFTQANECDKVELESTLDSNRKNRGDTRHYEYIK
ncbi:hypothetical protein H5410_001897 [Solanum commersonii]|uniref:Uncharacterized protein n=1 Tax=Solanum commersonii TaxID=4109 RepID=A0A9J6B0I2_SOLCO|nr:hypothetical protein H5410_001897 [Solanum commersonii]